MPSVSVNETRQERTFGTASLIGEEKTNMLHHGPPRVLHSLSV